MQGECSADATKKPVIDVTLRPRHVTIRIVGLATFALLKESLRIKYREPNHSALIYLT